MAGNGADNGAVLDGVREFKEPAPPEASPAHVRDAVQLPHLPIMPRVRTCRNMLFLGLFVVHFVILYPAIMTAPPAGGDGIVSEEVAAQLRLRFHVAATLATGLGLLWLALVRSLSLSASVDKVFNMSQALSACLFIIHGVILAASGVWTVAALLLALTLGDYLWWRRARERIVFVTQFLDVIWTALSCYPSLPYIILGASIVQFAFVYLFAAAVTHALTSSSSHAQAAFTIICLLLSLRWTTGVIKHTLSFVISVCVTAWLAVCAEVGSATQAEEATRAEIRERASTLTRLADEDEEVAEGSPVAASASGMDVDMSDITLADLGMASPGGALSRRGASARPTTENSAAQEPRRITDESRPTAAHVDDSAVAPNSARADVPTTRLPDPLFILRHAVTTALGSISAGAILGVVSPVMWACRRAARRAAHMGRADGVIARSSACVYHAVDSYLQVSHKYAYVVVATQGRSWFSATRHTWKLLSRSGADALIDDDVTDRMMLFGCYVGGGVLSLLLGTTLLHTDSGTWFLTAFLVFWFGFLGVALPLTCIEAAVSALFVSFAQVPEVLALAHPLIFHRFVRLSEVYQLQRKLAVAAQPDMPATANGDDL